MKKTSVFVLVAMLLILLPPSIISAEEDQSLDIQWKEGPASVAVGDMASLDLSDKFLYADKEDTVKLMEYFGNISSKAELGSVFSKNENENWFIIFEYFEIGHIKDDDKDKIDADEILDSIRKGTEEANKEREKKNIPPLNIKGWLEEPNYNEELHSLVWCVLCEGTNGITANYESRLLCREGYVAATLVCSDSELELAKPYLKEVINNFTFNEGKRYTDYVQGKDKLSDLGLAALVVGGTAVAVKKGLLVVLLAFLKKGGIVLFIPVVAFLKKLFGRNKPAVNDDSTIENVRDDMEEDKGEASYTEVADTYANAIDGDNQEK